MEWWHVYLFTRLDRINAVLTFGFVLLCCAVGGLLFALMVSEGEVLQWKFLQKNWCKFLCCSVLYIILCVLVPSQRDAAAIFLLPKLAKSDFAKEAQQIPTDAAKLMRIKLEEWISTQTETTTQKIKK